MPARALLNGEPAPASAFDDRACHFGDGLFETIAIRKGQPALWDWHWERLQLGCQRLGLGLPSATLLEQEVQYLCNGLERGILKIVLGAGKANAGYVRDPQAPPTRWLRASAWPDAHPWATTIPLTVVSCRLRLASQPRLAGIKHLNRLEQVLARAELPEGVDEGILCDREGRVIEAISANLLVRMGERWITPPLTECGVAGTVRRQLLERGPALGIRVAEDAFDLDELRSADAIYLTNALLGIRPVARIDDRELPAPVRDEKLEILHRSCFTFSGELSCKE